MNVFYRQNICRLTWCAVLYWSSQLISPWLPSFLILTYINWCSTLLSWRQNRLDVAFLGVRPVDSVIVGEVNGETSGPTQAISYKNFSLLSVQPRTLDLSCVPSVCPVQHPAEAEQKLEHWAEMTGYTWIKSYSTKMLQRLGWKAARRWQIL